MARKPALHPPVIVMSKFRSQRRKSARSHASEGPWKADDPFGPPHIPSSSFPTTGIRRIRNTLSKLSPSARAERQILKQKDRHRHPLTERNVKALVSEQELGDVFRPTENTTEIQVSAWLERVH
ncbi:hypothetical protein SI65_07837 [Aspergillus cristatus]|uniref:Uncharacterized protein n=1 Tax=Aspergillus cristatus TaxID=573508 RepID=A0A1E3B7D0_ASPCR|nr:hypothetical protein SI65_07837 [Aspergillus cristatus]